MAHSAALEIIPEEFIDICKISGSSAFGFVATAGSFEGVLCGFTYSLIYPLVDQTSNIFLGRNGNILNRVIQFSIETFFVIFLTMQVVAAVHAEVTCDLPVLFYVVHKIPCFLDRLLESIIRISEYSESFF
ncbi:MAG: hypothetical protein KAR79_04015 [Simkaniaceae bacterium]|nr:hypothetical protein [Simkaniaceae bacterium]